MKEEQKPLLQRLSGWISVILHPVFYPVIALLLLFTVHSFIIHLPWDIKRFDLLIVSINTLLIPIAYTVIFYRLKLISSLQMENRQERILPLILYIVFTYVSYFVLKKVHQPSIIWQVMLVISAVTFFSLLVSFRWKISLHLTGMGGLSGMLLLFIFRVSPKFSPLWMISLILAGVLGSSRLISNQHKPAEIYLGFLGGFTLAASLLWFMD